MIEQDQNRQLAKTLAAQIELSQELARIALDCPTCRELFTQAIARFRMKKRSDPSSHEVSQTVVTNPNNNAAGMTDSDRVDVSGVDTPNGYRAY